MDLVPWLPHELFLQLYLVFTHSCAHKLSETCPCKTHNLPKCLWDCRTPEAISLYHRNILPDSQSCLRVGLVSVFLTYLLCLLGAAESMLVNSSRKSQTIPQVSNMYLINFTHSSYSLPAGFKLQRIHTEGIRCCYPGDCRGRDISLTQTSTRQYFTPKTFSAVSQGVVSRVCHAPWATLLKNSLQNCVKQHWQWTWGTCCHRRLWRQRDLQCLKD